MANLGAHSVTQQDPILYPIPEEWQTVLGAIALAKGKSLAGVLDEAIALYVLQQYPSRPSLSAGLTYEAIESEPDEILMSFLDTSPQSSAGVPMAMQNPPTLGLEDMEEDEPDEILPGFAED